MTHVLYNVQERAKIRQGRMLLLLLLLAATPILCPAPSCPLHHFTCSSLSRCIPPFQVSLTFKSTRSWFFPLFFIAMTLGWFFSFIRCLTTTRCPQFWMLLKVRSLYRSRALNHHQLLLMGSLLKELAIQTCRIHVPQAVASSHGQGCSKQPLICPQFWTLLKHALCRPKPWFLIIRHFECLLY